MGNRYSWIASIILILLSQTLFARIDSVFFKSGEFVIGEIKSMDKGILKIETDYSNETEERPAAGASETDYVIYTGFGWKW